MVSKEFIWTDNPTVSGVSKCDTDVLNDCLMHLKYNNNNAYKLFDTRITDYILGFDETEGFALQGTYVYKEAVAGSRYGYPDFYNRCLEEKEQGTATEITLGSSIITMCINGNGHKFYDIADKDVVDTWYNTYGIADFYGVDTENERIFLPRNDKFIQLTSDTSKVNDCIEAGLPNITGVTSYSGRHTSALANEGEGALRTSTLGSKIGAYTGTDAYNIKHTFDASLSNPIYGNSNTVQPPSSLKLLYYCVGNTKVESAVLDVTEITTSENDTLPLFYNFYSKEDMTTTGAYVNASLGSWLSGNVYTTAYNKLVNKLGTDNVKANTDTYTDYDFVLNQDDMTFRLPLSNGDNYGVGNLYYKVGNSVTNLEVLDAGKVMNALNTVVPDNASLISSYGMCSGVMISLTPGASGTWYTAPTNGIVRVWGYKNTSQPNYINIYTDKGGATGVYVPQSWGSPNLSIRVAKGEKFQVTDYNDISEARLSFYYLKGEV